MIPPESVTATRSVTAGASAPRQVRVVCRVCGTRFAAERRSALTCSDACRQKRSRSLRASTPELPAGPFDLFYVDPPWRFESYSPAGQGKTPSRHYQTLDHAALCRVPVAASAARDALLAMWVYDCRLGDAFPLATAWGFPSYAGVLFTWSKRTKTGKPAFGTGYSTRKSTEQCLLFRRGKGLPRLDLGVRQLIETERGQHSVKPPEAMQRLEQLYGDVRRIELFARKHRDGWTGWGNQLPYRLRRSDTRIHIGTRPTTAPALEGLIPPPRCGYVGHGA